jgi:hypothetical protein
MAVNILKYASITNVSSYSGLPQRNLSRSEMKAVVGITTATGIVVPSLTYVGLEASLPNSFFCKDSSFSITNGSDYAFQASCQIVLQAGESWQDVPLTFSGGRFFADFNYVFPDMSQLVCTIRFTYINLSPSNSVLNTWDLLSVDYPMDYNYEEFSVAASSCNNYPILVGNHSVQGTDQDIRVMPVYTGDYTLDRVFVITASGKDDSDKYHVDRGINVPDSIPWTSGSFDNTMVSGRYLTLTGTAVSGSWTSPAIYVSDPNYISLYLYVENDGRGSGLERDWLAIDKVMDIRATDETPLPNFLINQWTNRLHTMADAYGDIPMVVPSPDKRQVTPTTQDGYSPTNEYWVRDLRVGCAYAAVASPCPYIYGRSDRIYMKGDGTILAEAPAEHWQMGSRDYWTGIPYKVFGAINKYWNAATFFGQLGEGYYACTLSTAVETYHHRLTFSTPYNSSLWNSGRDIGSKYLKKLYPFASYGLQGILGAANDPVYYDYLGSTTIPKPKHPDEWIVITAHMIPCDEGAEKYMCIYLLNARNGWTSEYKLLGIYGISQAPADEGYAICSCSSADEDEGGFWMHVGYSANFISKFTGDGYLVSEYGVSRGYNALRESPEENCLWAIRNDGVFYYRENGLNTTDPSLDVEFKVEEDYFEYLQAGDVDESGNLWVVDRDTATVYRINLATRSVDYINHIPYVVGVWPHPTDGSAFVYVGFNEDSFTTAIKRVWVDDPYQTEDLITEVPTMPLSDWSGVQFTGKLSGSYISPGKNDPTFGTDDSMSLEWQPYINTGLTIPPGKYKQFRLTFRRDAPYIDSPRVSKIRIPLPLVLKNVPFLGSDKFYVNPHLRYDLKTGGFSMDLLTWWEH